ncbi:hypothetical protein ABT158_48820 [Nonomuraea sp. NPDC001636]|uniref:hypothetical protein n=1 Tax=Nonomuraea sp. NPDC001636 TaxID=3154391 RepID=UPI0033299FAF
MHDIMRTLLGDLAPNTAADRMTLKHLITQQITCPRTGVVLDVRQAVAFTLRDQNGAHAGYRAVDAAWWNANRGAFDELATETNTTVELLDGRALFAE